MLRRSRIFCQYSLNSPPSKFHPLRLFGDLTCPFTHRCTIVAAHKRVPLDVFEVSNKSKPDWWDDFFNSNIIGNTNASKTNNNNKNNSLAGSNNNKDSALEPDLTLDFAAPILQVGSHFIRDSKVICEYLDATYPPTHSLLPPMPHIRAHVRQFQSACADLIDAMYDYLHFNPLWAQQSQHLISQSFSMEESSTKVNTNQIEQQQQQSNANTIQKDGPSSVLPIVRDQDGNIRIQHVNAGPHTSGCPLSSTLSAMAETEQASSSTSSTKQHHPKKKQMLATTTTQLGRARGRKKSVLASKIFAHQLALPKTCDHQELVHSIVSGEGAAAGGEVGDSGELISQQIASTNQQQQQQNKFNVTEESLLRDLRYQLRRVESYLDHSASPFLLGSSPSLGDMTLIPFIDRFRFVMAAAKRFYLLEEAPALGRLMQAAEMLSSFQRTRLHAQEYLSAFDYLLEEDGTSGDGNGGKSGGETKKRITRRLEIFTPPIEACPWSDAVRLTAALKNIEYNERPIKEFAQYEQKLIQNLRSIHTRAGGSSSSSVEFNEVEDERLMMTIMSERRRKTASAKAKREDHEHNTTTTMSMTMQDETSKTTTTTQQQQQVPSNNIGDSCSIDTSAASVIAKNSSFSSLLSNATGESVIVRPSSGLHPIRSALCACQYLVDAYSSTLVIPRHSIIFNNKEITDPEKKKNQKRMEITLEIDSHLDTAHQHYLLNYLEKHFGPRLCTYLHAQEERVAAENALAKWRSKNEQDNNTKQRTEEHLVTTLLAKDLSFARCRSRLQEAVLVIAKEIRAKPYSVTSSLCLADVVICSFFSKLDLKELCDLGKVASSVNKNNKNKNDDGSDITQSEPILQQQQKYLLSRDRYERLKCCIRDIQRTCEAGMNQSIELTEDDETKEKLIALRNRIFDKVL